MAAQIIAKAIAYAVAHYGLKLVRDGSNIYAFCLSEYWCYFATGENLVRELNLCIEFEEGWECWDDENEENIEVTALNLQQALSGCTMVENVPGFKQQQIIKIMGLESVCIDDQRACYTGLSTDKDQANWIRTTAEVGGFEEPKRFSSWDDFVTSKRAPSWAYRAPLPPAAAASPSLAAAASPRHAPQVGPQAAARALLRPPRAVAGSSSRGARTAAMRRC